MGRGGHGHGHGHDSDDDVSGTPYDQSMEELEFMRSACSAAQRGQTEKLQGMLDRRPELVHWVRARRRRVCALRNRLFVRGRLQAPRVLAQDGVAGNSGYTPLHYAAREGHIDCVRILLQKGVTDAQHV